jgi:GH3 auxin-responsive promoter
LERLAVNQGGLLPRTIWPELGWVLAVHGPGFRIYEPQLAYWYGQKFTWGMPYMACEGLIAIPGHPNSYSHIPAITTTFLEFIPESDWEQSNPQTCLVTQLVPGCRYDVVLTGWNGFYRYRLGDAIEVDDTFNGVPTFRVVSRRNGILSVIWEKTTEAQAVEAVARCESDCNISFIDFVIDIDHTTLPARYQLWAECSQLNVDKDILQKQFDINLRSTNIIYNSLRDNGEIGFPIVQLLPLGTFERFRAHREKEGASTEQYKVLHTTAEWKYASDNALRGVME